MAILHTSRGYPYPDDQERLAQYHAHLEGMAQAVDSRIGRIQRGVETITVNNAQFGQVDIQFSEAFTETPNVTMTSQNSLWVPALSPTVGPTSTGFRIVLRQLNNNNGSGTIRVYWTAIA